MKRFLIALLLPCILFAATAQQMYPFANQQQAARFKQLTNELRCLVCQNETIAASEAPLAADLRQHVYNMILQGKSDGYILSYMQARYGDFVLYKPKVDAETYLLWYWPYALLLLAAIVVIVKVSGSRRTKSQQFTAAELGKLEELLGKTRNKND